MFARLTERDGGGEPARMTNLSVLLVLAVCACKASPSSDQADAAAPAVQAPPAAPPRPVQPPKMVNPNPAGGWATIFMPGHSGIPETFAARDAYLKEVLLAQPNEPPMTKALALPMLTKLRNEMAKNASVPAATIRVSVTEASGSIVVVDGVHATLTARDEPLSTGVCSEIVLGAAMITADVMPDVVIKTGMRAISCKSTGCSAVFDMRPREEGGGLYVGSECLSMESAMNKAMGKE